MTQQKYEYNTIEEALEAAKDLSVCPSAVNMLAS